MTIKHFVIRSSLTRLLTPVLSVSLFLSAAVAAEPGAGTGTEMQKKEMMKGKVPMLQTAAPQKATPQKLQALVQLHTADELRSLLARAEQIANGKAEYSTADPIALVLHGSEIEIFKRSNYRDNKELVDLAARLDAFNVVDLKVCTRWMGEHNLNEGDLPPFLEAVPFGGDEVIRLDSEGYAYF